jgi:hypothetical protein
LVSAHEVVPKVPAAEALPACEDKTPPDGWFQQFAGRGGRRRY